MSVTGANVPVFVFGLATFAAVVYGVIVATGIARRDGGIAKPAPSSRKLLTELSIVGLIWVAFLVVLGIVVPTVRPVLVPVAGSIILGSVACGALVALQSHHVRNR